MHVYEYGVHKTVVMSGQNGLAEPSPDSTTTLDIGAAPLEHRKHPFSITATRMRANEASSLRVHLVA